MSVLLLHEYGVKGAQNERYSNDLDFMNQNSADSVKTALAAIFYEHNIKMLFYTDDNYIQHYIADNRTEFLKEANRGIYREYESGDQGDFIYFQGDIDCFPLSQVQQMPEIQ